MTEKEDYIMLDKEEVKAIQTALYKFMGRYEREDGFVVYSKFFKDTYNKLVKFLEGEE